MEHLAAIMMLVGCSSGQADCRELPVGVPVYETVEACRADMSRELRRHAGSEPAVYGTCEAVDPLLLERDVMITWDLTGEGVLSVEVIDADEEFQRSQMVAEAVR